MRETAGWFSPPPVQAQAFGEVAAERMLAKMHRLAPEVDVYLAADVAPAAATGGVLGPVSHRIGIDQATEEAPVELALWIVGRAVRNVVDNPCNGPRIAAASWSRAGPPARKLNRFIARRSTARRLYRGPTVCRYSTGCAGCTHCDDLHARSRRSSQSPVSGPEGCAGMTSIRASTCFDRCPRRQAGKHGRARPRGLSIASAPKSAIP